MNVIVVNDHAQVTGGSSEVATLSAAGLAKAGHSVTLFAAVPGPGSSSQQPGLRIACTGQRDIASDPNRGRAFVQGLWNTPARRMMSALLQDLDPAESVVHLHGWTKALSPSVIHEAASRGFPIVTTLHEYFCACPNGGFFNYRRLESCSLEPLGSACIASNCDSRSYPQKLWRVGRQYVQKHVAGFPRASRHFISISDLSERLLRPHLPADAVFHRVRNPIDVAREAPVKVEDRGGFVYVGRLSPEKGPVLLARAARAIGAPLTFVGDGRLRGDVGEANPFAQVTGWVSTTGVRRWIRQSRALVLPSLWHETQGLVVNVAAAMGVPAVVPAECAASETVADGVTGLWFRTGDQADLQRQMRRLHADPALAAALGRAAYERFWRDPPLPGRHVEQLERVYGSVLESSAMVLA